MDHLLALCGLLSMTAITPGPNNLVVLHAAARAGMRGALPAIRGIVLGGLLLLSALALGLDAAFVTYPWLRLWIGMVGALYLAWLGMVLLASGVAPRRNHSAAAEKSLPTGSVALVGFQFLNPKSWVMTVTALVALPATNVRDFLPLAALFVAIPTLCLLTWASLGASLTHWLARPSVRRGIDAAMGAALIAFAAVLLAAV